MPRLAFALLIALSVANPHLGQAQNAEFTIRPGDVLRVSVWREPALSGDFVVGVTGNVSHPLYKELNVVGKTLPQIEAAFRGVLSKLSANPQFMVEPMLRIAIGGEVRNPNLFTVSPSTTIAQAAALAGGTTERANRERVKVFRDGRELTLDLSRAESEASTMAVQSGDNIFVDRKTNIFRDYIAPAGSITAAVAAIANILLNK